MKLVITTQIRENYAAHEGFDGSYRWKYKGGETYVVPNFSQADLIDVCCDGIDAYLPFVTEDNNYFQEYVLNWEIVDDNDPPLWEMWEAPTYLELVDGQCRKWRIIDNTREVGYLRRQIAEKRESWLLSTEGDVVMGSYEASYTMTNGDVVEGEAALREWFQKEDA